MKCLNVALFLKMGRGQRETGCKYRLFFGGGCSALFSVFPKYTTQCNQTVEDVTNALFYF